MNGRSSAITKRVKSTNRNSKGASLSKLDLFGKKSFSVHKKPLKKIKPKESPRNKKLERDVDTYLASHIKSFKSKTKDKNVISHFNKIMGNFSKNNKNSVGLIGWNKIIDALNTTKNSKKAKRAKSIGFFNEGTSLGNNSILRLYETPKFEIGRMKKGGKLSKDANFTYLRDKPEYVELSIIQIQRAWRKFSKSKRNVLVDEEEEEIQDPPDTLRKRSSPRTLKPVLERINLPVKNPPSNELTLNSRESLNPIQTPCETSKTESIIPSKNNFIRYKHFADDQLNKWNRFFSNLDVSGMINKQPESFYQQLKRVKEEGIKHVRMLKKGFQRMERDYSPQNIEQRMEYNYERRLPKLSQRSSTGSLSSPGRPKRRSLIQEKWIKPQDCKQNMISKYVSTDKLMKSISMQASSIKEKQMSLNNSIDASRNETGKSIEILKPIFANCSVQTDSYEKKIIEQPIISSEEEVDEEGITTKKASPLKSSPLDISRSLFIKKKESQNIRACDFDKIGFSPPQNKHIFEPDEDAKANEVLFEGLVQKFKEMELTPNPSPADNPSIKNNASTMKFDFRQTYSIMEEDHEDDSQLTTPKRNMRIHISDGSPKMKSQEINNEVLERKNLLADTVTSIIIDLLLNECVVDEKIANLLLPGPPPTIYNDRLQIIEYLELLFSAINIDARQQKYIFQQLNAPFTPSLATRLQYCSAVQKIPYGSSSRIALHNALPILNLELYVKLEESLGETLYADLSMDENQIDLMNIFHKMIFDAMNSSLSRLRIPESCRWPLSLFGSLPGLQNGVSSRTPRVAPSRCASLLEEARKEVLYSSSERLGTLSDKEPELMAKDGEALEHVRENGMLRMLQDFGLEMQKEWSQSREDEVLEILLLVSEHVWDMLVAEVCRDITKVQKEVGKC